MQILEWVSLICKNSLGQMRNPEKGEMGEKNERNIYEQKAAGMNRVHLVTFETQ